MRHTFSHKLQLHIFMLYILMNITIRNTYRIQVQRSTKKWAIGHKCLKYKAARNR